MNGIRALDESQTGPLTREFIAIAAVYCQRAKRIDDAEQAFNALALDGKDRGHLVCSGTLLESQGRSIDAIDGYARRYCVKLRIEGGN